MQLESYSIEQLESELARREKMRQEAASPEPLASPNWERVTRNVTQYVAAVWAAGYERKPKDLDHYIFEAAVCAVFGDGVFDKLNARDTELTRYP